MGKLLEQTNSNEVFKAYRVTFEMDGTEAAILTDNRVIYHKDGHTTSISLENIVDIQHTKDNFSFDIIIIVADPGGR